MKQLRRIVLAVVAVVAVLSLIGGCTPGVTGIVPNPMPVSPSTWIPAYQVRQAITQRIPIGKVANINLEGQGFNSVSQARIQNALSQLVLDPKWNSLTAVEAFIVEVKRGDPHAAVGLGLFEPGPYYWAVAVDCDEYGVIVIRLIYPVTPEIQRWDTCLDTLFIAM